MSRSMFSESWHRVASFRAWLQPSVESQRQTFRGRPWHILRDPLSNQFYRLPPAAYYFIARLSPHKTIDEVWRECLALNADEAPGQEEVMRLISQLTQANLLVSDLPPDSEMLFQRQQKVQHRERRTILLNFLFLKIPLFNPDPFLTAALAVVRPLLNRFGFLLWLIVVGSGLIIAFENWEELYHQGEGLLAPENLFWLYACGTVVKLWHELGHGLLCKRFGGEVRICGIMFLILTPLPYVDVTTSWAFRHRWQRMLVGAGGMTFELFLAAIAAWIWEASGHGLVHSLAYNVMFLASVTTLAFNANPLLRFDGYYIFSDWLGLPNLNSRATLQLRFLLERYAFGCIHSHNPAPTAGEGWWLACYGVTSAIYRIFLIGVIALVISQHFFAIGILLAVFSLAQWIVLPIGKFIHYLWTDPALERRRDFALRLTGGVAAGLVLFLLLVPFPRHFRADGVVQAETHSVVYAQTAGSITRVLVPSGTTVKAGTPLISMSSERLDHDIESARQREVEVQSKERLAETEAMIALDGVAGEKKAADELLNTLLAQKNGLTILAPHDGIWVCPDDLQLAGSWADRGTVLGELIDPGRFHFTAVVPQIHADNLFGAVIRGAEVRLHGQAGEVVKGLSERVIPGRQTILPSAALGWKGSGSIEVNPEEPDGVHAAEPFFEVQIELAPNAKVDLTQRRTGVARFALAPEPLFFQWMRDLQQLLQARLRT